MLVEMLTAGKPWQQMIREDTNNHSIIFMVGHIVMRNKAVWGRGGGERGTSKHVLVIA